MPEVQPWWVTPLITLMVAMIGIAGTWLTVTVTRKLSERQRKIDEIKQLTERIDVLSARIFRLINYAQRLRDAHYRGDEPPPEAWPEDIYDDHTH